MPLHTLRLRQIQITTHKLISIELTGKLLIGSLMIGAGKIKPRKLVTSDEALLELITECIYRDCAALQTNDPRH